eukprot:758235-Hanusia_phi.AAC.5
MGTPPCPPAPCLPARARVAGRWLRPSPDAGTARSRGLSTSARSSPPPPSRRHSPASSLLPCARDESLERSGMSGDAGDRHEGDDG